LGLKNSNARGDEAFGEPFRVQGADLCEPEAFVRPGNAGPRRVLSKTGGRESDSTIAFKILKSNVPLEEPRSTSAINAGGPGAHMSGFSWVTGEK